MLNILIIVVLFLSSPSYTKYSDDPYQWLEEMQSKETLLWVESQESVTDQYFSSLDIQSKIKERLIEYSDLDYYGVPFEYEGSLYVSMRTKEMDRRAFFEINSKGEKRLILDFGDFPEKDNSFLTSHTISPDESLVAFGMSDSGSDEQYWQFMNLKTKEILPDILKDIYFSQPLWDNEGKGVYFTKTWVDEDEKKRLAFFYHPIGGTDQLILDMSDDPDLILSNFQLLNEGKVLYFTKHSGTSTSNGVYLYHIEDKVLDEIISMEKGELVKLGSVGPKHYFLTDIDAPNKRLVAIDLNQPEESQWQEIIPTEDIPLQDVVFLKDYIVASYLKDSTSHLRLLDKQGKFIQEIELPGKGTVGAQGSGLHLSGSPENNRLYYPYTDFTTPVTIYSFDADKKVSSLVFQTEKKDSFEYVTTQEFATSRDGTKVPVFITHKKGLVKDGSNPTLMYGYGGFGTSILPSYNPFVMAWLEMGGVHVSVTLRGGGEYGAKWHEEGTLENKQNVFDDFIAAATYLIEKRYTNQKKLAINGRSNGGLLVGAALIQRPDLFRAAIPQVGVFDLLKFHQFTVGSSWISEYGDPDNPEHREFLQEYSPYHNVEKGQEYPAIFITTADHDDRVVPLHSYKFAAKLQEASPSGRPILLRVWKNIGHNTGVSSELSLRENSEVLSFLFRELQMQKS